MGKTSPEVKRRYNSKVYENIVISTVPKGKKAIVKEEAESRGLSVNKYLLGLIEKDFIEHGKEF